MEPFYTHQQIELSEIEMDITHLVLLRTTCQEWVRGVKARLPGRNRSGYGSRRSALIAEISGIQGSSRETVQNFCRSTLGFHISIGAIQNVIDRASQAIEPIYEEIGWLVRQAKVNHVDETSFFQEGRLQWLWTMVNTTLAFFMIHAHHSKEAFSELIKDWAGILISDDYGVYLKWFKKRQTCLAYPIRRTEGLSEKKDEKLKTFGTTLLAELKRLCHWVKAPPDIDEELAFYNCIFHFLVENPERKDEAGKLSRRMLGELDTLWLFLNENGVEPTNSGAGPSIRRPVDKAQQRYTERKRGSLGRAHTYIERDLSLAFSLDISNNH